MIIPRFTKSEEAGSMAANAIVLPMTFLFGAFFQLREMPGHLQRISVFPLTYMNQGLRDALVHGNMEGACLNLALVVIVALALMGVAVLITRWEVE
ncbi:MAG: ABC transporter permease [Methanomassiliicoccales archaeon]|jgi:ABC-2 type transport system permease protein|nr:ABC transporter permease [Methanomassiliicoccales archaeon]